MPLQQPYLPLKGGGRFAKRSGWGSLATASSDPHPNPPPFRGREFARYGATLCILVVVTVGGTWAQHSAQFTPRDESPEDFPAGPGRDDTFYACTACHNFKLVAQQGMTRRQWEDSLQWMTDRHGMSPLKADEQKIVLDYLESTYPPRAPAGRGGFQNPFAPR